MELGRWWSRVLVGDRKRTLGLFFVFLLIPCADSDHTPFIGQFMEQTVDFIRSAVEEKSKST